MFELQRYELNPHIPIISSKKITAYATMRWKGFAISNNLDRLVKIKPASKEYRIIDLDTLLVVS